MRGLSRYARALTLGALIMFAVAGCAGTGQQALARLDDPALAAELRAHLAEVRPRSFSAVHRTVLSIRGREYVIAGYALGGADRSLRLRAAGDIGGALFDIEMPPANVARIVDNPGPLRDSWLVKGAARDLEVMYRLEPSRDAALARFADGEIGFVDAAPGGSRREFRFSPVSHCFVRYAAVSYGRRVYEARFSDARLSGGWPSPQPRRVFITDSALGYSLDVRVLEMRATDGG